MIPQLQVIQPPGVTSKTLAWKGLLIRTRFQGFSSLEASTAASGEPVKISPAGIRLRVIPIELVVDTRMAVQHHNDSACREWRSAFDLTRPEKAAAVGHVASLRLRERMLDRRKSFQEM